MTEHMDNPTWMTKNLHRLVNFSNKSLNIVGLTSLNVSHPPVCETRICVHVHLQMCVYVCVHTWIGMRVCPVYFTP